LIEKKPVSLVFLSPGEGFWMHMKISMVAAFIVSLPVIFHQLWKFISPGLVEKEKKYIIPFILTSTFLFLLGAAFCFTVILPFALTFLLGYKTEHITPMLSVGSYMDFCLKFILSFGAIFELPLVIVFLVRFGFMTPDTLAKNRRYAVLFAFIAAAILTPTPDAFNQLLMAIPVIILYEIGILVARILYRKGKSGK
jgi:sec-independent protein translocase protein TatC